MSVETIAAIWGGVAGAVISGIFGVVFLLLGRWFRQHGEVRCDFHGFFFAYTAIRGRDGSISEREVEDLFVADSVQAALAAKFGFDADLFNKKDVAVALREFSAVFKSEGVEVCSVGLQRADTDPPEDFGTVHVPSQGSVKIKAVGITRDTGPGTDDCLLRLKAGCDEVWMRATRENGEHLEWRIKSIRTSYMQIDSYEPQPPLGPPSPPTKAG
jgi:hypothetical protein